MKFINKFKKYICNRKLIPYVIVLTILLLSVGYSAFSSNLSIRDLYVEVRLQKDIRVTGVSVTTETEASTTYIDYNVSNIQAGINLQNTNSSITFNVVVTNIGSTEVGIKEIIGLPDNLDYEILNYNLKDKICDENNICKLGIQKEVQLKLKYKEGYYDANNTRYSVVLNFDFQPFYTVTYTNLEGSEYPAGILSGETLIVDFKENAPEKILVKINNIEITNYTYQNGVLVIPNVIGDIKVELNLDESICKLIKDNGEEGITPGDEYSCKVDPNEEAYTFYVLSDGANGTTNLILDRNVYYVEATGERGLTDSEYDGLVAWNESGSNANGPITAMNYLEKATASWTNLEKMTINEFDFYDAEGNFVSKQTMKTYNVYARLPYLSEVADYDWNNRTNAYLYNYLKSYNNIQLNPIEGIYGYWTFSACSGLSQFAWRVYYDGSVSGIGVKGSNYGVRPVINLKL